VEANTAGTVSFYDTYRVPQGGIYHELDEYIAANGYLDFFVCFDEPGLSQVLVQLCNQSQDFYLEIFDVFGNQIENYLGYGQYRFNCYAGQLYNIKVYNTTNAGEYAKLAIVTVFTVYYGGYVYEYYGDAVNYSFYTNGFTVPHILYFTPEETENYEFSFAAYDWIYDEILEEYVLVEVDFGDEAEIYVWVVDCTDGTVSLFFWENFLASYLGFSIPLAEEHRYLIILWVFDETNAYTQIVFNVSLAE